MESSSPLKKSKNEIEEERKGPTSVLRSASQEKDPSNSQACIPPTLHCDTAESGEQGCDPQTEVVVEEEQAKYYAINFWLIHDQVFSNKENARLFLESELQLMLDLKNASQFARNLFIRMFLRKRLAWFRLCDLNYSTEEVDSILERSNELMKIGCLEMLQGPLNDDNLEPVLALLNMKELKVLGQQLKLASFSTRGAALKAILSKRKQRTLFGKPLLPDIVTKHVSLPYLKLSEIAVVVFERVRHLFFLNMHQDQSVFLLSDLKKVEFPAYQISTTGGIFISRSHFLAYESASALQGGFDRALHFYNSSSSDFIARVLRSAARYLAGSLTTAIDPILALLLAVPNEVYDPKKPRKAPKLQRVGQRQPNSDNDQQEINQEHKSRAKKRTAVKSNPPGPPEDTQEGDGDEIINCEKKNHKNDNHKNFHETKGVNCKHVNNNNNNHNNENGNNSNNNNNSNSNSNNENGTSNNNENSNDLNTRNHEKKNEILNGDESETNCKKVILEEDLIFCDIGDYFSQLWKADELYDESTPCFASERERSFDELGELMKTQPFLVHFTVEWVLYRMLGHGVETKEKQKKYGEAIIYQRLLLALPFLSPAKRGRFVERICINLEHLKKPHLALAIATTAVADPRVQASPAHAFALEKRVVRLSKLLRRPHVPEFCAPLGPEVVRVTGQVLASERGRKMAFLGQDDKAVGVEKLALQHYSDWTGVHSETGIVLILFSLFFWEQIFMPVPHVFQHPFQTAPLDYGTDAFYKNRQQAIDERVRTLAAADPPALRCMLQQAFVAHQGQQCRGMNWTRFDLDQLLELIGCFQPAGLAKIFGMVATDLANWSKGVPDLVLWRTEPQPLVKFVEVKSARDRLSPIQIQWIHRLREAGIPVDLCKVDSDAPPTDDHHPPVSDDEDDENF